MPANMVVPGTSLGAWEPRRASPGLHRRRPNGSDRARVFHVPFEQNSHAPEFSLERRKAVHDLRAQREFGHVLDRFAQGRHAFGPEMAGRAFQGVRNFTQTCRILVFGRGPQRRQPHRCVFEKLLDQLGRGVFTARTADP